MRLGTPINYKTHSSKNTQRSLDENVKSSYYVIMWYILSQVEHKIIPSKIKSIWAATATWLFSRRIMSLIETHGDMERWLTMVEIQESNKYKKKQNAWYLSK